VKSLDNRIEKFEMRVPRIAGKLEESDKTHKD
jgi:hypothetical protein